MSLDDFDPWERISCGGQSGFVDRYTTLINALMSRRKGKSYDRLRNVNQRGGPSQSVDDSGFATVPCSDSRASSVVSEPIIQSGRRTSSGGQGKGLKFGILPSLLGRKRGEKDSVAPRAKKSKKTSNKSVSKGAGISSTKG